MTEQQPQGLNEINRYVVRHLRFGWWCLLGFLTLGILLEAFHGFKVGWYLDVGNDTRRLMGRLSHAHGTLLAVVNIVFALTLQATGTRLHRAMAIASPCLLSAAILMPLGFLLGGIVIYGGDPGLGIILVPIGGILLLLSVLRIAIALTGPPPTGAAAATTGGENIKRRRKR